MTASYLLALMLLLAVHQTYDELYERNYYRDEITISPHNYSFGSQGGDMKTRWGTPLATNVKGVITEASLGPPSDYDYQDDRSRVAYIITDDYQVIEIPETSTDRFSDSDAEEYAKYIAYQMLHNFEGRPFVVHDGNCINITVPEVHLPVSNAIWLAHYRYPYIHVVENPDHDRWCFLQP